MALDECDVAIVGAGPYGLACAAYACAGKGVDVRVFGQPMSFWTDHMPEGMLLRSPYVACDIADPDHALTLDAYAAAHGGAVDTPVPLDRFVDYGRWFQQQVPAEYDPRQVAQVGPQNGHFRLELADGDSLTAARVIVAAGIARFARIPEQFRGLPASVVSHSSAHADLSIFAGKSVLVVGGGQSALESAALLHEVGAQVEVLVREPRVFFLRRVPWLHNLGPITRLLFAPPEVGPAGISQCVAKPGLYRRLPRTLQNKWAARSLRPAGARWLAPRLDRVPIMTDAHVVRAAPAGDRIRAEFRDGESRVVDHILLATGYDVDITRYGFFAESLLAKLDRVGGYPRLSPGFETSVSGLHIVGAPSAWSFGPLMRFVAGTEFTASSLARTLFRRRR
jgi:cation diffusion facilitator CzcD-associated flavoprotein CzcO